MKFSPEKRNSKTHLTFSVEIQTEHFRFEVCFETGLLYRGPVLNIMFSALAAVPGMPFRWIKPTFHLSSDSLADSNPEWFDVYDSQNQSQQMSPKHQTEFDFEFDANWDY